MKALKKPGASTGPTKKGPISLARRLSEVSLSSKVELWSVVALRKLCVEVPVEEFRGVVVVFMISKVSCELHWPTGRGQPHKGQPPLAHAPWLGSAGICRGLPLGYLDLFISTLGDDISDIGQEMRSASALARH